MTMIKDWTPEKIRDFTHENLSFTHDLHTRPMFTDEGLAEALDRYPRDKMGVFTMGHDPVAWTTWESGSAGDLSGAQLLEAVEQGRIWLNLRDTGRHLPAYAELCEEICAEKTAKTGVRTLKRDMGLLISSANAQVFYHLDVALVSLWQIRGEKRVRVYPVKDPYVSDLTLERIVLRETAEQFPFDPAWDADAQVFDLTPGKAVTWQQNAPHRIVNGPMLNVSLSLEFMTTPGIMRANVIYANAVLRRRLGAKPRRVQSGFTPVSLGKVAIARGAKALKLQTPNERFLPKTFQLDAASLGTLRPL